MFGIDLADQTQQVLYSIKPLTLPSIFNVYLTTAAKKQVRLFLYGSMGKI